jgi:DNA-binding MarR family transcriptional regulator
MPDPPVDYLKQAGAAGIGGRLRRLSERLDADARRVYAEAGIAFEQRWLGVLDLLSAGAPLTVGEIAASLGISHPSVSQTRQSLAKAGLIAWERDPGDARRRRLRLTAAGAALVERLRPIWAVLDEAAIELDREAGGVTGALQKLEDALQRGSIHARAARRLKTGG